MSSQWAVEIPPPTGAAEHAEGGGGKGGESAMTFAARSRSMNGLDGDVMALPRDPEVAFGQSSLCFRNLAFSIRSRHNGAEKVILTPTSGAYAAGSMVALMVRGVHGGRNQIRRRYTLTPPKTQPRCVSATIPAEKVCLSVRTKERPTFLASP
jgi:hypothetical protein